MAHGVRKRVKTVDAHQLEVVELGRAGEKMHMRFNKAGHDGAALSIDDARARTFVFQHSRAKWDSNYLNYQDLHS